MSEAYPELKERRDTIRDVADAEERKFEETLDAGLNVLAREVEKLKPGQLFSGESAFLLHDTYGFPLDLTEDALKAWSTKVDTAAFEKAMEAQRNRSREDRSSRAISYTSIKIDAPKTEFLGYKDSEAEAKLAQVIAQDGGTIKKGGTASLIFNATPFYAESGGQVGDSGTIRFKNALLKVTDTQKLQEKFFAHECEVIEGEFSNKMVGESAKLSIDAGRRLLIRANHSATHLVHSALREVLGQHVKQAGSRVDENTLRFDYSHFAQVSDDQLATIQTLVNEQIRGNYEVSIRQMAIDEAKKLGAMALFGEKYGDVVRVVEIGPKSLELCGGTHVSRSGDIGLLMVASETGVSSGVRRIECYAGAGAHSRLLAERSERDHIAQLLKGDSSELPDKVEKVLARARSLEKELERMKAKVASAASGDLVESARISAKGIKVISQQIEGADADTLKSMVDGLRVRLGSGVVALGSHQGDKAVIVAGVTPDLVASISAGNIVKEIAKISGGRGGGRADFAQAGGVDPQKLVAALERVFELVS
jgi:alanyl-tRNA synthetase